METSNFRSETTSKKLLFLIYSWIGIIIIISVHSLYSLLDPVHAKKYDLSVGIVGIIGIVNIISLIVIFTIWVYKLHKDLNSIFPDYSITPKKSLQLTLIPVYNAWGIWKMAKELFVEFNVNEIDLSWANIKIQNLYILLFIIGGIDNGLTKLTANPMYTDFNFQSKLLVESLSFLASVLSPILWYIILVLTTNGMRKIIELSKTKKLY